MGRQFDVYGLDTPCIDLNLNLKDLPQKNHGALVQTYPGKVAARCQVDW